MEPKKTLVIGASEKSDRYSNMAIKLLLKKGHEVVAIGIKKGITDSITIENQKVEFKNIDTITLYLNPAAQKDYYSYIINLKPVRIIFNPGTENNELRELAEASSINTEYACTLVLLNLNQF
jgi:predicted CoA-binding protein